MAKLESLIVDLQLNTAELKKGLDNANKQIASFNSKLLAMAGFKGFTAIASGAFNAAKALAEFAIGGAESMDTMGKQAALVGDSVEHWSALTYAMGTNGIAGEDLAKNMQHLSKNIAAAASGGKEQSELFKALGIDVTDAAGNVRNGGEIMEELSGVFAGLQDDGSKTAIALELFGKSGAEMSDALSKGPEALRALMNEAQDFGAVVSTDAANAAGEFGDNLDRLKTISNSVAMQIAQEALPAFNDLFRAMFDSKELMGVLRIAAHGVGVMFKNMAWIAMALASAFDPLLEAIKSVATAWGKFATGDVIGAGKAAAQAFGAINKTLDVATKKFLDLRDASGEALEPLDTSSKKSGTAILKAVKAGVKALNDQTKAATEAASALKDLQHIAEDYERQVKSFGSSNSVADLELKLNEGELAEKLAKIGDAAGAMRDRIMNAAKSLQSLENARFEAEVSTKLSVDRSTIRDSAQQMAQAPQRSNQFGAWQMDTASFSGITAAVMAYEQAMITASEAAANAARAARNKDLQGEADWTAAQRASEAAAARAQSAADAFSTFGNKTKAIDAAFKEAAGADTWAESLKKLNENFKALGTTANPAQQLSLWVNRMGPMMAQQGTKLLGAVGDLVNSVVEGAKSGGVWGAIIAMFMEIASKTKSAMKFLGIAMEFIEQIAAMVEPLVKPIFDALQNVLGVVIEIVEPVFAALVPLFESIGKLVNNLAPIFYALGDVLTAISPILEFLGNVIGAIFDALAPIFDLIGGIIKVIATVLLGIIIAANELAAFFGDAKAKEESNRLKGVIDAMWARTPEMERAAMQAAGANLEQAAAAKDSAAAMNELSESLTNVPDGFRYAAAAYQAGGLSDDALFTGGTGDTYVTVEGTIVSERDFAAFMERIRRNAAFRDSGYAGTAMENIR